ncbi:phage tail protein [Citrobacter freundii]|uniref:phage tail protein n=6 Tax=Citrobacter freundii TaxID=546 RepID=UPI002F9662E6
MATKYLALLTNIGAAKLAKATALGTKVEITQLAVGDGNGVLPTPNPAQTALVHERRRAPLNMLTVDPANVSQIIAEQVIPEDVGGWWIREIGLFDKDGDMVAIANCAETYKPQLQEGSGRVQVIRVILIVSSTEAVTLKIDPAVVLATRQYVDSQLRAHEQSRNHPDASTTEKGFVQLSSSVTSDSESQAATPKAVKIAMDNANARLAKERNLSDLPNPALARQNLQLGDSSTKNTGTTANTVAAGDDARITGAMQKSQNGADIQDVAKFLQNLGLGKTDSPEFGSLTAPNVTLRPGKISFLSSEDGKIIAITVNGESVAEIKSEHIFHKRALVAGEFLQAPKLIFRDGDINFYSGPGNLVMQVGGEDVATLTPDSFYHVKQVAAAESLKAPKVILRDGDVNLVGGENNLVIQVGGNDVATLTADNFYHVKQVAAAESLKAPKVILRDGDVNLVGGANNLVIQVGGNDIASLTPGNNFFKGKLTAETSLQVGSTCILATDGNLTGSKWGGWLDAFMKDGMSTDGNGLWWDAFSSQLQFRIGDFNIADAAGGAGTSVTFPKAFKNGCLMVIPVPGNGGAAQQIGSQSYSSSGAVLQKGASDKNPRSGKYLAIGY